MPCPAWPICGCPRRDFAVRLDGGEPLRRRARCVVVGNVGLLPGGFVLLPEARLDDGRLDVGILAPSGALGWPRAAARVLTRQPRARTGRWNGSRPGGWRSAPRPTCRGRSTARSSGPGRTLTVSVCPGALTVRQPTVTGPSGDALTFRRSRRCRPRAGGRRSRSPGRSRRGSRRGRARGWPLRGRARPPGQRGRVDVGAVDEGGVALQDGEPLAVPHPQGRGGHAARVADEDVALRVGAADTGVDRAGRGHAGAAGGGQPGAALEGADEDLFVRPAGAAPTGWPRPGTSRAGRPPAPPSRPGRIRRTCRSPRPGGGSGWSRR